MFSIIPPLLSTSYLILCRILWWNIIYLCIAHNMQKKYRIYDLKHIYVISKINNKSPSPCSALFNNDLYGSFSFPFIYEKDWGLSIFQFQFIKWLLFARFMYYLFNPTKMYWCIYLYFNTIWMHIFTANVLQKDFAIDRVCLI